MNPPFAPRATYRLQFHKGFTFRDAADLVPYLDDLGISDAYASPILKARPGSSHGYDITDHRQLNPEVGSEDDLNALVNLLSARGMGIILDIVPNHMAVVGNENTWWNDVLENGPSSPYSGYFDIAWTAATRVELHGRVLIPILGDPYAKVLEARQIQLVFDAGAFFIQYFDHRFPVAPRSYGMILGHRLPELEAMFDAADPSLSEYKSILTAVKHLPRRSETDPDLVAERQREKEVVKRRLAALTQANSVIGEFLDQTVTQFNGVAGDAASFNLLEQLLDDQGYRLAFWRVAAEEINYRRFFDVNELAALSMERSDVFTATHELVVRLIREGKIRGVRIDHPDGLFDPLEYLDRLQIAAAGMNGPLYAIVEKILGPDESLPPDWPTAGTSGYEFLNQVNGLFVDANNAAEFSRIYAEWIGDETTFAELVYQKKILILQIALAGEMQMLTHQLDRLAQRHRSSRDFTRNGLRIGLREIIASFPVYRSYIAGGNVSDSDRRHVLRAVRRAALRNPALSTSIFIFIRDTLLLRSPAGVDADYIQEQRRWVGKFQQVTAPVMAKAAEDTAAYIFNRLISLNEVGGDPDRFGVSVADFHDAMRTRQAKFPDALSATATHDTKRGEDVRARINVLSEIPDEWRTNLVRWSRLNERHRVNIDDSPAPDRNEECFIYQTLIGAWPDDHAQRGELVPRLQAYLIKALHEAKVHTSWINPNQPYDDAILQFLGRILDPEVSGSFLDDFTSVQRRIREFGMCNSLAQTLLKIAAPGVPDFYQGTELWDLSLVDPDNRRPVDYESRRKSLNEIAAMKAEDIAQLIASRSDGRLKMFVTQRGLALRRQHAEVFARGDYVPLEIAGPLREHAVGFARVLGERAVIAVVPRLLARLTPVDESPFTAQIWQGTTVRLANLPLRWRDALTNETIDAEVADGAPEWPIERLFRDIPVCLLSSL